MFRAHGELSIHAGVIKIQAIFCKFGFGKLAVALSTSWHAAVALHLLAVAPNPLDWTWFLTIARNLGGGLK